MALNYNNLELAEAERIDLVNQVNTNWNDAATFTENRIKVLENIATQLPAKEGAFIQNEQAFLNNSLDFIRTFSDATQRFVEEEVENTRRIQQEIENHRPEQEATQSSLDQTVQAIQSIEERIRQTEQANDDLAQRKRTTADLIKPAELDKVTFKDFQDESNDVFKWVLQVIYKESRTSYAAKNFKQQAFKKDKGVDFLARVRGLALTKLNKDDFDFGKQVIEKKDAFLADLEPKGKQNASLRALFDFISLVNEAGNNLEVIETSKTELDEQKKQLEAKQSEKVRLSNLITVLEGKLKASQTYINKLERLTPLYERLTDAIYQRQGIQTQYQQALNGDSTAVENLINNNIPVRQVTQQYSEQRSLQQQGSYQQQHVEVDRQTYEQQVAEGVEGVERVEGVEGQTVQGERYERAPVEAQEGGEEEGFEGQTVTGDNKQPKKVESKYPVPATDLKESEFANSKKGSCESCSIF